MAVGLGPDRSGSHVPWVVVSLLFGVMLVTTAFAGLVALGASRDLADVREDTALLDSTDPAQELVTSLQDERNYGASYILGFENALDLGVDSLEEATAHTDEALASFRAAMERQPDDLADSYEPVLSDIDDQLADLRQRVDGLTGERSQNQTAVSEPLFEDYTSIVEGLLAVNVDRALSVDDPELRQGARLLHLADEQPVLVARLIRALLLAGVGPGGTLDSPDDITPVAADQAVLQANQTELLNLAHGGYESAGAALADTAAFEELTTIVRDSINGEVVPIATLTAAAGARGDLPSQYAEFGDAVETTLDQRADDLEQQAENRRLLWFCLTAAAAAGAMVTLVVLIR